MNTEEKFYFTNGQTLSSILLNDLPGNIRRIESAFGVKLSGRDFWVGMQGETENVETAKTFFSELSKLQQLRQSKFDQAELENLLRLTRQRNQGDLQKLFAGRITVGTKKREIMPRSAAQMTYLNAIREHDVVFGLGPAGTGKTYLAMAMAVSEFLKGNYSRIVLTRPAREAGENLGFLPGSLEEKIMPYLRPLYDALYEMMDFEEVKSLMERNIIEVAPLAFMRGRTLNGAFIILDEAQNTTSEQMLMFLTRLGFKSKCVITGDPSQVDLPHHEVSGLAQAEKILAGIDEIAFCRFAAGDVVRHALLEKIIRAYRDVKIDK